MKPKPLSSLNHFTVPLAIAFPPALVVLRTRRLLSKGYERWHCDVGRNTRPDRPSLAPSKITARRVSVIGPTGAARPTAATSVCGARIAVCTASKTEDERKRIVDDAQLGGVEAPGRSPKTLGIDDGRLLDEHTRVLIFEIVEIDRRAKARWPCACRSRGDERRAEVYELLGLHHDGVARAALLSTARAARGRRHELRHLLTDDAHLLAIALVGGQTLDLLADRRARSSARGRLAQCGADRLGIREPVGTNHVEGGYGGVVEANVKRRSDLVTSEM